MLFTIVFYSSFALYVNVDSIFSTHDQNIRTNNRLPRIHREFIPGCWLLLCIWCFLLSCCVVRFVLVRCVCTARTYAEPAYWMFWLRLRCSTRVSNAGKIGWAYAANRQSKTMICTDNDSFYNSSASMSLVDRELLAAENKKKKKKSKRKQINRRRLLLHIVYGIPRRQTQQHA